VHNNDFLNEQQQSLLVFNYIVAKEEDYVSGKLRLLMSPFGAAVERY
jgi:uncharacterized membrane protein YciS (DUF1049 family)